MKAVVYEEFSGPISVQSVADPNCQPDSVIVCVEATGICRSDWHGWMGHDADISLPHVPGHELAGTIVECGNAIANFHVGDRVTVPFASGCGRCRYCEDDQLQICDNYFQPGFTHWGSFAELVELKFADINLVRLPDSIDFVTAASLGCRFATSYRAIIQQGKASAGETVVVYGCGGVGLSAVMIAKANGCRTIGVDIDREKLDYAKQLGTDFVVNASEQSNVPALIHEETHGGADVSIDALGSKSTCRDSILSLRKQGRHVQVGLLLADESDPPIPMSSVIANELSILGSHGMSARTYPEMLNLVEQGKLDPKKLVSRKVSLSDAPEFLQRMNEFSSAGITVIDELR